MSARRNRRAKKRKKTQEDKIKRAKALLQPHPGKYKTPAKSVSKIEILRPLQVAYFTINQKWQVWNLRKFPYLNQNLNKMNSNTDRKSNNRYSRLQNRPKTHFSNKIARKVTSFTEFRPKSPLFGSFSESCRSPLFGVSPVLVY